MKTALIDKLEKHKNDNELLNALWLTSRNEWEAAHQIAQRKEGDWAYDRIHALLHRIEGDEWNARYWYSRVNAPFGKETIDDEWNSLAAEYLDNLT